MGKTPDLVVRYLGHAAFVLRSAGGTTAVIDPYDNEEDEDPWFLRPIPPVQTERYFLEFEDVDRVIKTFRPGVVVPIHHRQPEISAETTEVGPIIEWLTTQQRVKRKTGEVALDRKTFPEETEVWVLEPMPGPSTGPVVNEPEESS